MKFINHEPADIMIYLQDKGMVLKEKSLVAFDRESLKIAAVGTEAEPLSETAHSTNMVVLSPLRCGMVADYETAVSLFTSLLHRAWGKKPFRKPCIAVCVPPGIEEVEKRAMEDAIRQAGAREILITELPIKKFIKEMPKQLRDKYHTIIGIAKDEPEGYIREELSQILKYAAREGISAGRVAELLCEMQ